MRAFRSLRVIPWLVTLALVLCLAAGAEAQRHKKKRHRRPPHRQPPSAQVEPAPEKPAPEDNPYGEDGGAGSEQASSDADGGAASGDATGEAEAAAAEPEPAPPTAAAPEDPFAEAFGGPDLGPLRDELTSIMDELVQTRSRMAVLGRQLFKTRVRIDVQNRAGDDQTLAHLAIELDGAPVYESDGDLGEDATQVFEGFAAPGPHLVTVVAKQRARADDAYHYELRDTYRVEVVRGKRTEVTVVLDDDSDIAEDFADDEEGEYDVRTRLRVATRELDAR